MSAYPVAYHQALAAHSRHAERLMTLPNVVGVAVGLKTARGESTDEVAVRVFVTKKVGRLPGWATVPPAIDDVRTDVVESGHLQSRAGPPPVGMANLMARQRPAFAGCSVSGNMRTGGTLGAVCRSGGNTFILSANHVIATSLYELRYTPVFQPETPDVSSFLDMNCMGILHERVPYRDAEASVSLPNEADAAIALVNADDVDWAIPGIGLVRGVNPSVGIGTAVRKVGCATGHTAGVITDVEALVDIKIGESGDSTRFVGLQIARIEVAHGDSGSLVVDENSCAVGLLTAMVPGGALAFLSPASTVVDRLGISLTMP